MNGLKLKGGQASSGPHTINPLHTVMTRQRQRHESTAKQLNKLRQEFGGFTDRGGFFWSDTMPRKVARAISRTRTKFLNRFAAAAKASA